LSISLASNILIPAHEKQKKEKFLYLTNMKILVADYYHHHILSHKVDEIVLSILGPNFKAPSNRGTPSSRGQENLSEMKWDESDENSYDVDGGGGGSSVQSPMEVSLSSAVLVKNNQPSPLESTWIIESKRGKVVPDILNFYFVFDVGR
jgi:hypothetical protein